jgi:hypothetical protein
MFMPDERLEWANKLYKEEVGRVGKRFAMVIEATIELRETFPNILYSKQMRQCIVILNKLIHCG